jgi:hypothetical protein
MLAGQRQSTASRMHVVLREGEAARNDRTSLFGTSSEIEDRSPLWERC